MVGSPNAPEILRNTKARSFDLVVAPWLALMPGASGQIGNVAVAESAAQAGLPGSRAQLLRAVAGKAAGAAGVQRHRRLGSRGLGRGASHLDLRYFDDMAVAIR